MRVISQCAHLRRVHRPARCRRSNRARTEDLPDWQDPYQIIGRGSLIRRRRRAQPGHRFPAPGGHSRSPEDTKAAEVEIRTAVADPGGHARTRH
jgi:hypothetical protein